MQEPRYQVPRSQLPRSARLATLRGAERTHPWLGKTKVRPSPCFLFLRLSGANLFVNLKFKPNTAYNLQRCVSWWKGRAGGN